MNNFEKLLSEIIKSDPYYMITLLCGYYDECACCPLHDKCLYNGADADALKWLLSPSDEYEERTK